MPGTPLQGVATRTRWYLYLLVLSLPIDYFKPTGVLLREAGAKPAIPLMLAGSAWIFWRHWPELFFHCPRLWRTVLLLCLAITFLSTIAFVTNVGLDISYWDGVRSPWGQFVAQGALFVVVAPVLIAHAWLFSREEPRSVFLSALPSCVAIHLAVIGAEWIGLLHATSFPLSLFRGDFIVWGRKPTGLMTEPSYVGTFAATYGLALLLCMPIKRWQHRVLALASIVVALVMGGKTMIPALVAGLVAYGYQTRAKILNWKAVAAVVCVGVVGLYTVLTYSVLNVQANLSSAMRIGSTILALNAAASGYGLLGIGFGQFHFIYSPRFAPDFLLYVPEASYYFTRVMSVRESTYNLPARFLVEDGVLGLLLFVVLVWIVFKHGRSFNDLWHQLGAVLAGASLGFLLTQDNYFFPAFVCGAAILASRPARSRGES